MAGPFHVWQIFSKVDVRSKALESDTPGWGSSPLFTSWLTLTRITLFCTWVPSLTLSASQAFSMFSTWGDTHKMFGTVLCTQSAFSSVSHCHHLPLDLSNPLPTSILHMMWFLKLAHFGIHSKFVNILLKNVLSRKEHNYILSSLAGVRYRRTIIALILDTECNAWVTLSLVELK